MGEIDDGRRAVVEAGRDFHPARHRLQARQCGGRRVRVRAAADGERQRTERVQQLEPAGQREFGFDGPAGDRKGQSPAGAGDRGLWAMDIAGLDPVSHEFQPAAYGDRGDPLLIRCFVAGDRGRPFGQQLFEQAQLGAR